MSSKLTPLALLIPAVVLAQPAPQVPAPKSPQLGVEGGAQLNAPNQNKAAAALVFKRLKSSVLSNDTGVSSSYRKKIDGKTYICTRHGSGSDISTYCYSPTAYK
jgi:hypothetical protein